MDVDSSHARAGERRARRPSRLVAGRALAAVACGAGLTGGLLPAVLAGGGGAAPALASYRVGSELDGMASELSDPTGMPAGIVNQPGVASPSCVPSPAHPDPVVLVHGTFANENFTWQALAPMLANAGYCVYGLNYGATSWTTGGGDHSFGIDRIESSAAQLALVVTEALSWTTEPAGGHPARVDVVGHSQGGLMPRYFIEHGWDCAALVVTAYATQCTQDDATGTSGASLVHEMIGMAPSNHGADAYGLVPIFERLFGSNTWTTPESFGCGSCDEQEAGSPFLAALNGPGGSLEAAPGVLYTVLETADDEVVTPAPNALAAAQGEWPSAFLHGPAGQVRDVRLQDQCPTDATDHIGIVYDPVALWDVMAALAGDGTTLAPLGRPPCPLVVPPLVSG